MEANENPFYLHFTNRHRAAKQGCKCLVVRHALKQQSWSGGGKAKCGTGLMPPPETHGGAGNQGNGFRVQCFVPHHVRLTLLDLTGCTLKPGLQREASEPPAAPTLPPDLSVQLPLHCTSWPAWAFPSLNFVMNCPVHGHGALLKAAALPLAPARTPARAPTAVACADFPNEAASSSAGLPGPSDSPFVPHPREQ